MNWFKVIGIGAAIVLLVSAFTIQHITILRQKVEIATLGKEKAEIVAAYATEAAQDAVESAAKTAQRIAAQGEIANESQRFASRARADAVLADDARVSLRHVVALVAASCRPAGGDPAAAAVGASGASPSMVLADVFGRADDTAGELAKALDDSFGRGKQCERDYDTLN